MDTIFTLQNSLLLILILFILFILYLKHLSKCSLAFKDTPFNRLLLKNCPTIASKTFTSTPYLLPAILQTWFVDFKREDNIGVKSTTEIVDLPNGGQITLEYLENENTTTQGKSTMAVILPGLTACIKSPYILALVKALLAKGYKVCLYLSRLNRKTFNFTNEGHICLFQDFHHAMMHLKAKFPYYSFLAVGHSYGANQLVNYLGIYHKENIFKAAVSLANPLNFLTSENKMRGTIYDKIMTKNVIALVTKSAEVLRNAPKQYNLDFLRMMQAKTLREFDGEFAARVFGFESADDYYWGVSSVRRLKDVKIPLLVVNSEDDPVVEKNAYPLESIGNINENVILLVTKRGGHLGWFSGVKSPRRWYLDPTMEFLQFVDEGGVTSEKETVF